LKKNKLNWGETVFDDLSNDELRLQCLKMFAALQAAHTVIKQTRISQLWRLIKVNTDDHKAIQKALDEAAKQDGYWGKGIGGRAYEMVNQALEIAKITDAEEQYRSFWRYAVDLLFTEPKGLQIGFGWSVCPKCGVMVGRSGDGKMAAGNRCNYPASETCDGIMRLLTWEDLSPKNQ
jgi:hypothetical protein